MNLALLVILVWELWNQFPLDMFCRVVSKSLQSTCWDWTTCLPVWLFLFLTQRVCVLFIVVMSWASRTDWCVPTCFVVMGANACFLLCVAGRSGCLFWLRSEHALVNPRESLDVMCTVLQAGTCCYDGSNTLFVVLRVGTKWLSVVEARWTCAFLITVKGVFVPFALYGIVGIARISLLENFLLLGILIWWSERTI